LPQYATSETEGSPSRRSRAAVLSYAKCAPDQLDLRADPAQHGQPGRGLLMRGCRGVGAGRAHRRGPHEGPASSDFFRWPCADGAGPDDGACSERGHGVEQTTPALTSSAQPALPDHRGPGTWSDAPEQRPTRNSPAGRAGGRTGDHRAADRAFMICSGTGAEGLLGSIGTEGGHRLRA